MVGTVYRNAGDKIARFKIAGTALALALGAAALAVPASAQDRGERGGGEHRGGGERGGGDRGGNWTARSESQPTPDRPAWNGGSGRAEWNRAQTQPAPRPVQQQAAPQASPQATAPGYRSYADPGRNRGYAGQPQAAESRTAPQQGWDGRRWNGQTSNGQSWTNRAGTERDRSSWQRDRGWDSNRDRDRGDPRRGNWSAGRPDGRWDRDWRRDNRYNWQGWRDSHRDVYRLGRYYPPYRDYAYRRLGIGFFLDGGFFGSSYWIGDPWMYRLPPAYGPYRWVRYYDDALLVDTYTGEVVDVIYDVFW